MISGPGEADQIAGEMTQTTPPPKMRASAGRRKVKKCEKPHTLDQPAIHQGFFVFRLAQW